MTDTTGFVSADSHVNEPQPVAEQPSTPTPRPSHSRDQGRRRRQFTVRRGHQLDKTSQYAEERMPVRDLEHRYRVMREGGIARECIFPTIGLYVWMLIDAEGSLVASRIYNDWICDTLGRSPRLKCVGLVSTWTVDDGIAGGRPHRRSRAWRGHDPHCGHPGVESPATGENARRVSQPADVSRSMSGRSAVASAEKGHWHARDFE